MRRRRGRAWTLLLAAAAAGAMGLGAAPAGAQWETLEPGLELAMLPAPQPSASGDSTVRVLRIDPVRFELKLFNASAEPSGGARTAREWAKRHGLAAAINASMYQTDYRSSVSLMQTRTHVNNRWVSKDNTVLAFDRLDDGVPAVQIIDRTCQDFAALRPRYGTLVQSIRMIGCDGRNVWTQRPEKWSTTAIGTDGQGRVLFMHVRSPYSTHDLIDILLALPLDLRRAMYVEGGPEAQLYIDSGGQEHEFVGSHGTGFVVSEGNSSALPIPNVIGIARREVVGAE